MCMWREREIEGVYNCLTFKINHDCWAYLDSMHVNQFSIAKFYSSNGHDIITESKKKKMRIL